MRLYHGSTFIVEKPNLEILNHRTDFGKGFYTTTDIEQAEKWTKIKKERLEKLQKDANVHRYVNVYEYTENESLNILEFSGATEEWLKFVFQNRTGEMLVHDYDVIKGPVANDNLYAVLDFYSKGLYNVEETVERLKTYKLSNQISFHTAKSLKCLQYIETIELGG